MTTERLDSSIERAFARTGRILDAIEAGDFSAAHSAEEMAAAQPWDLVSIGQAFVLDQVATEREIDNGIGQ